MEIGERLKEVREEMDMSLETLQEKTKIQKRYLTAIENGDFHVLPGTFYSRAFIKEYALAVGLDPNELLDQYKEDLPSTEVESTEPYTRMQRTRKRNEPKSTAVFSFIPTLIVVLLVIGILFVAWTLYQKSTNPEGTKDSDEPRTDSIIRNPDDKKDPEEEKDEEESTNDDENKEDESNDENETEKEEKEEEEINEAHTWETTEVGTGASPESTLLFTSGTEDVKVLIETVDDTWLTVKDDAGKVSMAQMLTSVDSPLEVDASDIKQLYIKLGNASTATISINGEEMEFPADPKKHIVQSLWINIKKAE